MLLTAAIEHVRTLEKRRVAVVKSAIQAFLTIYTCARSLSLRWCCATAGCCRAPSRGRAARWSPQRSTVMSGAKSSPAPLAVTCHTFDGLQGGPGAHAGRCRQAAAHP